MLRPARTRLSVLAVLVALLAVLAISPADAKGGKKDKEPTVPVRLLTINDLHGALDPPAGSSGRITNESLALVDAGGAAYLSTHIDAHTDDDTLLVAAGDLIGATPLLSAAYHDEPTIQILRELGLEASAVGNHEFDEGYAELLRIMDGQCHPVDGCSPAGKYKGSKFDFLGANVKTTDGDDALEPFHLERINGEVVGFIGLVTRSTPTIVTASGIEGLDFRDEVTEANKVSNALRRMGVQAQVVLMHEGDQVTPGQSPDSCPLVPGAGSAINAGLSPEIDVIVSGHSHQAYVCQMVDPAGNVRYMTQGSSNGRVLTQIDFRIDKKSNEIVRESVTVDNHVVTRTVTPDPEIAALLDFWRTAVAPVANRPIGTITADIPQTAAPSGESPMGLLLADAFLEGTAAGGGAEIAFMNSGGVRNSLNYVASGAEGDGVVTYGEAFAVQPFNNLMQVITMTGAQLDLVLEQQFTGGPNNQPFNKILQPSENLAYTVSSGAAWGSKVSGITIDGVPVTDGQQIRVAVSNFLVGGGDAYTAFTQGTDVWSGPLDIDLFEDYLIAHPNTAPPVTNRVTMVP